MITVENAINATLQKVWEYWTLPEHIIKWNYPSPEWGTTHVENDLRTGGRFKYAMASKDGSMAFDFEGVYICVETFSLIAYQLEDNRTGSVHFEEKDHKVILTEKFEPEAGNSENMQEEWCQSVIDNFKKYVESN